MVKDNEEKTAVLHRQLKEVNQRIDTVEEKEKLQRFMFLQGIVHDRGNQTLQADTVNSTFELIECINNTLG
ncbi:MAG: hypothetical protein ACO1PI_01735 [Bacteroidota bacterium]|jgi:hypothetical protein